MGRIFRDRVADPLHILAERRFLGRMSASQLRLTRERA